MVDTLLTQDPYVKVALNVPLRATFDYKIPKALAYRHHIRPGMRVKVPFGKGDRHSIGLVIETSVSSDYPDTQIKPITALLDDSPIISQELFDLCAWAARYYHHPIGEVFFHALPTSLRKGETADFRTETWWFLTEQGKTTDIESLKNAKQQKAFLDALKQHAEHGLSPHLLTVFELTSAAAKGLEKKGLVRSEQRSFIKSVETHAHQKQVPPTLNPEQAAATHAILAMRNEFGVALLDGITGSGKTEVFLRAIEALLKDDKQILVMVPEIGLTPQTLRRFESRFNTDIVLMHSNMTDRERLDAWLMIEHGQANIIIGTRSSVFVPATRLGLIIIDEEHDASYKQHEGFRYHARDLAIKRAQGLHIPVLLASATPSYESMANALQKRYHWLKLRQRAGDAQLPQMERVDLRGQSLKQGFSEHTLERMRQTLERKEQVLVFLNRRGYAPTLMCHQCGWIAACDHCDVNLTVHKRANKLHCHHCDSHKALLHTCPECHSTELFTVGEGTEQIEGVLNQYFKHTPVLRIDRDSTQRKTALTQITQKIHEHDQAILVGTQMLAKGHHFPNVTLVVIMDADVGLFSSDFRGMERTAQLITQVAGRAGRSSKRGHVLLQTYHPDHSAIECLCVQGYEALAMSGLRERQQLALPPFYHQVVIRAESQQEQQAMSLLMQLRNQMSVHLSEEMQIVGPYAAIIVRKAGQHRALLSLKSPQRGNLHRIVALASQWLEQNTKNHKIRFAIDVDPLETF
ncbi:primosomal protein N' [Marinomonas fungiae]|uniref:Replication restart protein PriA n=1 Tax=Marinomonas fungiae TaxID=1137284 RepID=A0A0K6IQV2_9GAMM|nr:primosomal protein N' [Marinomonas fungiae]CUB05478.1 replication restart DNA helicase PriA [Marinomonas fungiae]